MLAVVGARLITAIESCAFVIEIVELTSPINHSTKRTCEMVLIAESEIIGWVGCWKHVDCLTASAGAPRVWLNNTSVHFFPGAGMEGGFSIEVDTPVKAKKLAILLQSALDEAFDSINILSVKSSRFNPRFRFP